MEMSIYSDQSSNLADIVKCFFIALTLAPLLADLKRAILGDNRLVLLRIA